MSLTLARPGALEGRRVLVTGGGTGFGRAMALAFAAEGARVAVCGRRPDRLSETARLSGGKVKTIEADVRDEARLAGLASALKREWGGLDGLVLNAAVLGEGEALSEGPARWREVLETNATGPYLAVGALLPLLGRGARVAAVTSGLGFFPMSRYGAYCVSKAALNMLVRVLALDLADRGILVNAIDPGTARTEMNPAGGDAPETIVGVARTLLSLPEGGPTGRFFKKNGKEIPLG